MTPYYEQSGVTIYHGDCREVLPSVCADVMITDPPYGVGFAGKTTKHTRTKTSDIYEDTEEYFREVVLPVIGLGIEMTRRAAIFTGTRRLHEYPQPADIGGIVCPNGGGRSRWGFGCYHPVAFYGTSPHVAHGCQPTVTVIYHPGMHVTGENNGHPCPKPLAFMRWLINFAAVPGETIVDPFMGSGTTLVAAKNLYCKAIGIELEEKYCEIAAKRLQQEALPLEVA